MILSRLDNINCTFLFPLVRREGIVGRLPKEKVGVEAEAEAEAEADILRVDLICHSGMLHGCPSFGRTESEN